MTDPRRRGRVWRVGKWLVRPEGTCSRLHDLRDCRLRAAPNPRVRVGPSRTTLLFGFRPPIVMVHVSEPSARLRFTLRDTSQLDGLLIAGAIITAVALALLLLGVIA